MFIFKQDEAGILKTGAADSSEMSVTRYPITRCYTQDRNFDLLICSSIHMKLTGSAKGQS
jgi:hypothetical protein